MRDRRKAINSSQRTFSTAYIREPLLSQVFKQGRTDLFTFHISYRYSYLYTTIKSDMMQRSARNNFASFDVVKEHLLLHSALLTILGCALEVIRGLF